MKTDFLMITVLREERDAFLAQLPGFKAHPQTSDDARIYFSAEVLPQGQNATYHLTILCLPGMGRVNEGEANQSGIAPRFPGHYPKLGIAFSN